MLTEYCLEIARGWGIKKMRAGTTPDNICMIRIFKKFGFQTELCAEEGVVLAEKELK